jgi:hypothetical protein
MPLFKSAPALSKAFRFMQTNRGVALSDFRSSQARTRLTPLQRFAKAKLCLSIRAFYAFANLCGLRGVRTRVGWVERSDTHHRAARMVDGFRKGSKPILRCAYLLGTLANRLMISPASKPIASAHSIISTTSTSFWPVST